MTGNQDKKITGSEMEYTAGAGELNSRTPDIMGADAGNIEFRPADPQEISRQLPPPEPAQPDDDGDRGSGRGGYGFLELVYGVLFDPGRTFAGVAADPPLWQAVLIYIVITVSSSAMGIFIDLQTMNAAAVSYPVPVVRVLGTMLPFIVLGTVLLQFIKWFIYSGLLHLVADFYGGRGDARGVFTVYGLAGLPNLFVIPVQLLTLGLFPGNVLLRIIIFSVSIAVSLWGIILLVMGIRAVHRFSTGRAVVVVLTPVAGIAVLLLLAVIVIISLAASVTSQIPWLPIF